MTRLKQKANNTKTIVEEKKCNICKKAPIEVYQLDTEVCYNCWMAETFISFVDQVAIPEV
jgi:hypothetical protein